MPRVTASTRAEIDAWLAPYSAEAARLMGGDDPRLAVQLARSDDPDGFEQHFAGLIAYRLVDV